MSWLVLFPNPTATALAPADEAARPWMRLADTPEAWAWALSTDGQSVAQQGLIDPTTALPAAESCVLVLPMSWVSWQPARLPRVSASRLAAALAGALEDHLLDDRGDVHLALRAAPGDARPRGQHADGDGSGPRWVAAVHKPLLQRALALWAARGRVVDAVVAAAEPPATAWAAEPDAVPDREGPAGGHVRLDGEGRAWLRWSDAQGVVEAPLELLRQRLALGPPRRADWSAEPAAVEALQRVLDAPPGAVRVVSAAQDAWQAARSGTNLLQFDLAPPRRGLRWLGDARQALGAPAWAWARRGLWTLLALGLAGPAVVAALTERDLRQRQAQAESLLRQTFPEVRAVLDAPLQMERQVRALRTAAGLPGPSDLDTLLAAAAAAWPPDGPAPAAVQYDGTTLTVQAPGLAPERLSRVAEALRAAGWSTTVQGARLEIRADSR